MAVDHRTVVGGDGSVADVKKAKAVEYICAPRRVPGSQGCGESEPEVSAMVGGKGRAEMDSHDRRSWYSTTARFGTAF